MDGSCHDFGQQSFDLTQGLAGNGSGASARGVVMNKVVLAFAVTALVTAAFSPLDAREFKHSGCAKAAKIQFPTDRIARKDFKHWCKDQWKMYKASRP